MALVSVFCLIVGVQVGSTLRQAGRRSPPPRVVEDDLLRALEKRYGTEVFSQGPEELLIRDFFNDRRDGVFVDVGAFDPIRWSNTYRLEHDLGWSGIAIDALEEFRPLYEKERPRTTFFVAFVGDTDHGTATLHVDLDEAAVASGRADFTELFTKKATAREVTRRTLDSILSEAEVKRVDFLSMDIELGEPEALRGFTIEKYKPRLVCIEAHGETRQTILDYMARHAYVLVGRYLRVDPANLYFTPLDGEGDARESE